MPFWPRPSQGCQRTRSLCPNKRTAHLAISPANGGRTACVHLSIYRGKGQDVGAFTSFRVKVDCMALMPGSRRIVFMAKSA